MDKLKRFGAPFLCFLIALLVATGIFKIAEHDEQKAKLRRNAILQCLDAGYPRLLIESSRYYCVRKIDGSDQVMRVEP